MKRLITVFLLTALGWVLLSGLAAGEVKLLKGQTLYVPSQTSFFSRAEYFVPVNPTVFIHNADQNNPINLVRIDFYDTGGKLVKKFLDQPRKLNANAAMRINIKELLKDEEGSGAHFIIQWQAENKVVDPLVQTWFAAALGTRGYAFTSPARVIQEMTD